MDGWRLQEDGERRSGGAALVATASSTACCPSHNMASREASKTDGVDLTNAFDLNNIFVAQDGAEPSSLQLAGSDTFRSESPQLTTNPRYLGTPSLPSEPWVPSLESASMLVMKASVKCWW